MEINRFEQGSYLDTAGLCLRVLLLMCLAF
jgi:hypothetical protein